MLLITFAALLLYKTVIKMSKSYKIYYFERGFG